MNEAPQHSAGTDGERRETAMADAQAWSEVHDFWFPAGLDDAGLETHRRMLDWWFGGGSNLELPRFRPLVAAAEAGRLSGWRDDPLGRLSLVIVLDQFRRGLFAGTPAAYAADLECLRLVEEGLRNGHYHALTRPWEKTFFLLPLGHVEGPGHLDRMRRLEALAEAIALDAPERLRPIFQFGVGRVQDHRDVIVRFGRFPHRNTILGRISTAAEAAYLRQGDPTRLPSPAG
jgi:uncharacterized protein (DUF924 family)